MEEIKKALETIKSNLEEAQELYLAKLETALASIKNAIESIPKPSPITFEIDKILSIISSSTKTKAPQEIKSETSHILSLKNSLIQIDKGKTQVEILDYYLKEASKFASRVAIFIFKNEQAVGWKGLGFTKFGSDDMRIKSIIFPLSEGNPFYNTFQNKSSFLYQPLSEDMIAKTLGGPRPEKIFLIPLIIKDKVAAALYADEIKEAIPIEPDLLEILTYSSSLCISLIGQRHLLPSPTLSKPGSLKLETLRPSKPEVPPPPAPPPPVQPPPSPEKMQKFDIKAMEQLEAIKKETLKKPTVEMPKEPTQTVQIPPVAPKPVPPPEPKVEPPKVEEVYEVQMEEIKEVPEEEVEYKVPEAAPPSEWISESAESSMKEFEPKKIEPTPPPPSPPPADIEEIYAKKSVEVKPPIDFKKEKPGFGFESIPVQPGLTPEESRRHDEARRFARLLVSEIKLYNENKVEEGKKNKNIYSLLKEDIDRSKQLYEERIAADIRAKSDYFKQALISILASGDASALGLADF